MKSSWLPMPRAVLTALATLSPLVAQTPPARATATATAGDEETIVLSPFEVRSERQNGYQAGNAVTASRFALPVLDTPMSIAVVTEQFMQDIGARDALESLSYVSGITQGPSPVRLEGSNAFNIRGATSSFVLRDGVASYGINDSYNIQRWEVLKGITGMMYGSRNLGGVVNAVAKKPQEKRAGELFARTDSYGSWRFSGDLTGPLTKDKSLTFRLMAFAKDEKTFMDFEQLRAEGITGALQWKPFPNTRILGEFEYYGQKNTLATKLAPLQVARSAVFAGDDGSKRPSWNQRIGHAPVPTDFNYGGPEAYLNELARFRTLTLDQKITDWLNFRSYASYATREQERLNRDAGATFTTLAPNDAPRAVFDFATGTTAPETAADSPYVVNGMNSNLRENKNWDLIWRNDLLMEYNFLGASHRTLLGVEYQERSGDFKAFDSYSPVTLDGRYPAAAALRALDGRGRVNVDLRKFDATLPMPTRGEIYARRISDVNDRFGSFNGSTNETLAFYGVHYLQFWRDRVTVMGGLRQDRDRTKRYYDYARDLSRRVYSTTTPTAWTVRNSPQGGVSVRVRPDVSVYASYSDVLVANNTTANTYLDELVAPASAGAPWTRGTARPQRPQTGVNMEVGVKTDLFGGRLSSSATLFRTQLTDKAFAVRRDDPTNITLRPGQTLADFEYHILAGEETYEGLEIDVNYQVRDNWSAVFSYAYTSAAVTKDSATVTFDTDPAPGAQNVTRKNTEGLRSGNVPRHQFRLWNSYRFKAAQGLLRGAGVGVGVRYYGESPTLNTYIFATQIVPAYTVVDLSAWKTIRVFGRDVSVTARVNNALDERYYATRQIYGEPLSAILEARHRF